MDKKLLKYWKTCLLDAEWGNSALNKELHVTLAFEDRMPVSLSGEDITLLFPEGRVVGQKYNVRMAPCTTFCVPTAAFP